MGVKKMRKEAGRVVVEYLTYNRSERRGIAAVCVLLLMLATSGAWMPEKAPPGAGDTAAFMREVRAFEAAWRKAADSDSIARITRSGWYAGDKRKSGSQGNFERKAPVIVELNSADTLDLQQLRGIGPGFARRIVAYREKLGGYVGKEQLLEVFGMDTARYRGIEASVRVDPSAIKGIDVNTATFKELMRHPYVQFAAAKAIVLHRQKVKVIRTADELKALPGVSDSLFRRMLVYLRFVP